ncbi:hypothetical protein ROZALSC1DRAFT_29978, partial [Rozella allomycis CSF55]
MESPDLEYFYGNDEDSNETRECVPDKSDDESENDQDNEKCSICLHHFNDKSRLDKCFLIPDSFCFECINQWSLVNANCPLCKCAFTKILHNFTSNDYFEIVMLLIPVNLENDKPMPSTSTPRRPRRRYNFGEQAGSSSVYAESSLKKRKKIYEMKRRAKYVGSNIKNKFRREDAVFSNKQEVAIRISPWVER